MCLRDVRLFLLATAAAVAALFAGYGTPAGDVAYTVVYLALCGVAWWAALRLADDRRPWLLIALAQTLWFLGDAIEMLYSHLAGEVPSVGVADACWLAGYPLVAAALVRMARRRAPGRLRGAVLDAGTLTIAAALLAWEFLISPYVGQGYSLADTVVPALYPVADVVLLAGVLVVVLSPGTRGVPTRLLSGAAAVLLGNDLAINVLPQLAERGLVSDWLGYEASSRLGTVVMLGNALMTAALLHPGRAELTRSGRRVPTLHPARVLFLGLALMTTPTLTLAHAGFDARTFIALGAAAMCTVFVLSRFTIAVREQDRTQAQLAFQAQHDPLTGLANRAALGEHLAALRPTAQTPVTVLYLDLDGFKEVNDSYGHDAGDAVLVAVAGRLAAMARAEDLVSRLGGDEFVLVCLGAAAQDAVRLADRIVLALAQPVPFRGHHLSVGASIGIASTGGGPDTDRPGALLRSADAAMYQAKRLGRGRWVLADAAPGPQVPAPVTV
ncbi:diguanylate cyclase [Krasilnikovia sp. M28-CT-15]|uniref:diguanylate cyclase n=1 Tax=Krasilnikovia sp. M28-CT-15 TaxID=3373540 RepID=UPI003875C684